MKDGMVKRFFSDGWWSIPVIIAGALLVIYYMQEIFR